MVLDFKHRGGGRGDHHPPRNSGDDINRVKIPKIPKPEKIKNPKMLHRSKKGLLSLEVSRSCC